MLVLSKPFQPHFSYQPSALRICTRLEKTCEGEKSDNMLLCHRWKKVYNIDTSRQCVKLITDCLFQVRLGSPVPYLRVRLEPILLEYLSNNLRPYPQILDQAGKACLGQTHWLICQWRNRKKSFMRLTPRFRCSRRCCGSKPAASGTRLSSVPAAKSRRRASCRVAEEQRAVDRFELSPERKII